MKTSKETSLRMQAIKSKGTKIEKMLWREFDKRKIYYLKNYSKLPGKPDIVMPQYNVVVFCDSEFWHGHNWAELKRTIKKNIKFWVNKIELNIKRDRKVNRLLRRKGWHVMRLWGRKILENPERCVDRIMKFARRLR